MLTARVAYMVPNSTPPRITASFTRAQRNGIAVGVRFSWDGRVWRVVDVMPSGMVATGEEVRKP